MALLTSRLAIWLMLAAAIVAAFGANIWQARKDGERKALQAVEQSNRKALDKADDAERAVLTCPPGLWDRERRACATKLH